MLTEQEISDLISSHGTGGWQTVHDMGRFALAIESAATAPLLARIAELEAERDQARALFYKAKDEYHGARQESALRWKKICELTEQRDAKESKLAQVEQDVQPVAWRHSKTYDLCETEHEVQLADGDEWAEPLFLHPAVNSVEQLPCAQITAFNGVHEGVVTWLPHLGRRIKIWDLLYASPPK